MDSNIVYLCEVSCVLYMALDGINKLAKLW